MILLLLLLLYYHYYDIIIIIIYILYQYNTIYQYSTGPWTIMFHFSIRQWQFFNLQFFNTWGKGIDSGSLSQRYTILLVF